MRRNEKTACKRAYKRLEVPFMPNELYNKKKNAFMKIGLTQYEAEALAVTTTMQATAWEITRITSIPQTKTYFVMERLTDKGLTQQDHNRPKKYNSKTAEETIKQYCLNKINEISRITEEALNDMTITQQNEKMLRPEYIKEKLMEKSQNPTNTAAPE